MIEERRICTISYTTDQGDQSQRRIIPTSIPSKNMKAIDLSELSAEEQLSLLTRLHDYNEYVESHTKRMYSFEDWVSHVDGESIAVDWRSFKVSNVTVVD